MTYEVTGRIARITFNRPEKGNAIIAATPVELAACVERADLDPDVHVILVSGRGEGFCAGFDLSAYADGSGDAGGEDRAGTVLDAATQATLNRGEKLVELLKQGQYAPVAVQDQVIMMHAAGAACLDKIPTPRVLEFEKLFLQHMRDAKPEVGQAILDTGKLSDEDKAVIVAEADVVKAQMGI